MHHLKKSNSYAGNIVLSSFALFTEKVAHTLVKLVKRHTL